MQPPQSKPATYADIEALPSHVVGAVTALPFEAHAFGLAALCAE